MGLPEHLHGTIHENKYWGVVLIGDMCDYKLSKMVIAWEPAQRLNIFSTQG